MTKLSKENLIPSAVSKKGHSTINMIHSGTVEALVVNVDIRHSNSGDLSVKLLSPSGKSVTLQNKEGKSRNIQKSFSADKLKSMVGEKVKGTWELHVKNSGDAKGNINAWRLDFDAKSKGKSECVIPDQDPVGLSSSQDVRYNGIVTGIKVKVDIKHPYVGDLQVKLISPSKKSVILHNREGGSASNLKKTYNGKDALKNMLGEKTAGKWELQVKDFAVKDSGTLKSWKMELQYRENDDLKIVEGIGPKIESIFNEAGIYSWRRLSKSSPALLKQILDAAGDRYKMHDPGSWPEQAQMAFDGEWTKLEKWQDKHKGGRK